MMEKDMIIPSVLALSKLRYEAKKCDWTTARQHAKMEKLHSDSQLTLARDSVPD